METNQFKTLSESQLHALVGGFSWAIFIPLAIQGIAALVGSIKMFTTSSGSLKVNGTTFEGKWDDEEPKEKGSSTKVTNTIVYAY